MNTTSNFLAQSKKAIAGGVAAGVTAAGTAVTAALSDSVISTEEWGLIASAFVGGFVVGALGVYFAPKNAQAPDVTSQPGD